MPAYDPNNIFAKILRGELPCYKIYEDDKALAFLDIMPRASGHALVLPKAPARNILDVSPDDLAHVMRVAQKIAKASVEVFSADGVTIQQFNESAGGQVVFHLHVHVIPRKAGVALKPPASVKEAPDVLAEQAKQLSGALKLGGTWRGLRAGTRRRGTARSGKSSNCNLNCHTFGTRPFPRCYARRCCSKCDIKHDLLAMFEGRLCRGKTATKRQNATSGC